MFLFEEPSDLNDDWYLGDKNQGKLPNELLKNMSSVHILGIQFLFESFVKKRAGVVLNEDEDLNMPLQVCAFLSTMKQRIDLKSPVLIISSDCSLSKWHYHAFEVGFKPHIITSGNFDNTGVYILSSDSLKLATNLLDQNLFCVVIDDLDAIVTKLLVRKLRGTFNIGLTTRNFYKQPNQKLKWSMLNWANPGCVGKLNDFYRIDRLHFEAFADNYRFWWMRLTWNFCNSFEPPSEEELKEYQQKLHQWSLLHNIKITPNTKPSLKRSRNNTQATTRRKKTKHDTTTINDFPNFPDSSLSSPNEISAETNNFVDESKEVPFMDKKQNLSDAILSCVKSDPTEPTESAESDEEIFLLNYRENIKEQESDNINCKSEPIDDNSANEVKTEVTEPTKDKETDEDEPILSLFYPQTSMESTLKDSIKKENDSRFNFFSDMEDLSKSQSFRQISNVLDKLSDSEDATEISDDDSFFSELVSGKK